MFEKLRQFLDDSKSILEDAFVVPDDEDFIPVPPGVTEEQLIDEAKQYVDAIIVPHHDGHHQNLVGVEMNLDQGIIADNQKAVTFEVFKNIIVNCVFIEAFPVDEELCIKFKFELFHVFSS